MNVIVTLAEAALKNGSASLVATTTQVPALRATTNWPSISQIAALVGETVYSICPSPEPPETLSSVLAGSSLSNGSDCSSAVRTRGV